MKTVHIIQISIKMIDLNHENSTLSLFYKQSSKKYEKGIKKLVLSLFETPVIFAPSSPPQIW